MKKTTLFLFMSLFTVITTSCKSDDDNSTDTTASLIGTIWEGQQSEDGTYTFSSTTEFTFVDIGEAPVDGTYTFNGSSGVLTEETGFVAPFSISGGIMEVEGVNSTRVYIRQ